MVKKSLAVVLSVLLCNFFTPSFSRFLSPEIEDNAEIFSKDGVDYIFVREKTSHILAENMCMKYDAHILHLVTMKEAIFLAEALSETDMSFDTLWTAGRKTGTRWYWKTNGSSKALTDFDKIISENKNIKVANRRCLGFGRNKHSDPQLRPLSCTVSRSIICRRGKKYSDPHTDSTHPGWITIGSRKYKIFRDYVDYFTATMHCLEHDQKSRLAVIPDYKTSQILGRYLLIGRPSLENAWTEGKWKDGQYRYISEPDVDISNVTNDKTKFPPWKSKRIEKSDGCVLLDRHLAYISLFVESRCERLRPYICYKNVKNTEKHFEDVYIGDRGYRLYRTKLSWNDARKTCRKLNIHLAEPDSANIVKELLFVMAENVTAAHHIWIGGKMINKGKRMSWVWASNSREISKKELSWVKNETYHPLAEEKNLCLNMDRENHNQALHYGASCDYQQYFVCATTKENLKKLDNDDEDWNVSTTEAYTSSSSEDSDESTEPTKTTKRTKATKKPSTTESNTNTWDFIFTTQMGYSSSTSLDERIVFTTTEPL